MLGRDHVLLAPPFLPLALTAGTLGRIEHARRQHHGNQPAMLQDVDPPQLGYILEQSAETVLRVAG
jgi:hypothetical protein